MRNIKTWIDNLIIRSKSSPLWRLFLTGLKGQL